MWPAFPGGVYIPHFQAHWINKQAGKRTFDTSGEIYSQEHDNNTKQVSKLTWSNWFGNLSACIILTLILERLTGKLQQRKQMKVSNMTHESIVLVAVFLRLQPYNLTLLYENLVSSTVMNIKAWRNRGGRCWSWIKAPPCCWTLDHLTFYPPWQSYRERPGIRWKEKAQWSQACTEWDTKSADDILHSWILKLLKSHLLAKTRNCHCLFDNNCN